MQLTWGPVDCGGGVSLDTSLTEKERDEVVRLATGGLVLEIGSAFGYSALQMARVAKHVFAVDPHLEQLGGIVGSLPTMRSALRTFGLDSKVTICLHHSQEAMPALHAASAYFDFIFIDGDHHGPAVEHDLEWALRLTDGPIAFHDYDEVNWPDVKTVLDDRAFNARVIDTLWVLDGRRD